MKTGGGTEEGKIAKTKIFPDVDSRFKFSIVFVQKSKPSDADNFSALFYLNNPHDLHAKKPLDYSLKMVKSFSPDNLSIMEFGQERDYELCSKIRAEHDLLGKLNVKMRREFNLTDDNKLFKKKKENEDDLPLFEGKMIHQFNSVFSQANYFIEKDKGHEELIQREANRIKKQSRASFKQKEIRQQIEQNNLLLEYQTYRLAYRVIARSTDERTFISTIIPKNSFSVYSVYNIINLHYEFNNGKLTQNKPDEGILVYYMALFNSFVLNYYLRNKISANLTTNFLYELPIPKAEPNLSNKIIQIAFALLYNKSHGKLYEDLRVSLGIDKAYTDLYNDSFTHNQLRAELEILIAKDLYGLNKGDWQYLTSTFVYGENQTTRTELNEIIRISNELSI